MSIAIVVPTIRDIFNFKSKWADLIKKHSADLIIVYDGKNPIVELNNKKYSIKDIMGRKYADLIYHFNDGIRNVGFALAGELKYDYILSLDDDVTPIGDTIQDHLDALNKKYPISWLNTSMTEYMRGFPYNLREEAECWVSHGVWEGIPDYDGIRQLSGGIKKQEFYKGPIPRGVLFPMCAMNFCFKREALPYIYQFPATLGVNRFCDIFGGIECKKDLDRLGKCAITGFSKVYHERMSNPYDNLIKEAKGIRLNDNYELSQNDEYFILSQEKRKRWKEFVNNFV